MRQIGGTLVVVRDDGEKAFVMMVGELEWQRCRRWWGRWWRIGIGELAVGIARKVCGGGR